MSSSVTVRLLLVPLVVHRSHIVSCAVALTLAYTCDVAAVCLYARLQKWTFYLKGVYDGDMLNICIKVTPAPARDSMAIEVVGPGAHNLFDPTIDWSMTAKQADFTTLQGSVALTADPADWGRVYSRGIFVAVDQELRALRVAVNVRTQLTRDRHVLPTRPQPTPLDSLAEILAALLRSAVTNSPSCTALFTHLLDRFMLDKKCPHIITAAQDSGLKPVMKAFHAKQLGTVPERIVYTGDHCDEKTAFVLDQLDLFVARDTGALRDPINLNKRITELLAVSPDYVPTASDAPYLAALRQYVLALSMNSKLCQCTECQCAGLRSITLSAKVIQLKQYCMVDYKTHTVYMTSDLLQHGNWRAAAISVLNALSATASGNYFEHDLLVPLALD
jgi:hypothetical protein